MVLLGWLTTSTMRTRREQAERNLAGLLSQRLNEFDEEIQQRFDRYVRDLSKTLSSRSNAIALLKDMQRSEPILRTGIFVSADGLMLFPQRPNEADADALLLYSALSAMVDARPKSKAAESSYDVTSGSPQATSDGKGKVVKNGRSRSFDPTQEDATQEIADRVLQSKGGASAMQRTAPVSIENDHQWQVWYMDEGAQLVLWFGRTDGSAVGLLLERSRWMSDLISILPDSISSDAESDDQSPGRSSGFTALVDETQRIVYRWGDDIDATTQPTVSRDVSPPLSSWQLQYHAAGELLPSESPVSTLSSLAAVAILLLSLGAYVLTSVQRQMASARSRVNFAGQVSHELRTPLTNIRLYTELAESDLQKLSHDESRESIGRRLAVIDRESRRLQRLVSGVLEMIRDSGHRSGVRRVLVNPNELIQQAIEQFEPGFAAVGISIQQDIQSDSQVMIDPDVFEMILVNLLSNVEKYAGAANGIAAGQCRITSRIVSDQLVVTVSDDGPGIAPSSHRRVFQPFSRLDDSINAPSGTGIGLTIARRAAERHSGELKLVPSDRGATFEFRLPIEQ
ncbi:Sensor protein KdpD [Stieleria varia]|uniref:histidine kinase n=2 Tax=Stieleria varia TaxID=2528005 RepID=A0A5C6ATB1_9BACT|nr:Sensor protein KdpD [Stieleria varia]